MVWGSPVGEMCIPGPWLQMFVLSGVIAASVVVGVFFRMDR